MWLSQEQYLHATLQRVENFREIAIYPTSFCMTSPLTTHYRIYFKNKTKKQKNKKKGNMALTKAHYTIMQSHILF